MRTTRVGALVAGSALTLGLLSSVTPAAQAAASTPAADAAVAWLQKQVNAKGLLPGFGTADYSLTADYALGLQELGLDTERDEVLRALVDEKDEFIGDGVEEASASVAAQALWASTQLGSSDNAVKTRLEGQVLNADEVGPGTDYAADAVGRVVDLQFNPWTGTITQAWTVAALEESGSDEADEALGFLLKQQCEDGSFRFKWSERNATDQSCDGDPTSYADIDSTAYVLILLSDLAESDPTLQDDLDAAAAWLVGQQNLGDGSFNAGYGANANSTGLASRALAAAGLHAQAVDAANWLVRRQAGTYTSCPTPLANDRGAIAFDDAALKRGVSSGIGGTRGSWQFATAQSFSALALAAAAPASQPTVAGPAGYQQARTPVTYTVRGAVPSTVFCFAVGPVVTGVVAGGNGAASVNVTLPAGTATRSVVAADRSGARGSTTTTALDAKTIPFRMAKKVKRKRRLNVLVSGLAAREKVTVRFRKRVYRGIASPAGTYIARIKIGPHRGKVKVRVAGQFPAIRNNTKTVRVVR